jgi:hypothetical protein
MVGMLFGAKPVSMLSDCKNVLKMYNLIIGGLSMSKIVEGGITLYYGANDECKAIARIMRKNGVIVRVQKM